MNLIIEGKQIVIHEPTGKTFRFLTHPYNFNSLMPPEVNKFEAGEDWFLFGLGAIPEVKMKVAEVVENEKILLRSASDKLNFELECRFRRHDEENTDARLIFRGEFNMMMKMMVEKPLRKFIEHLSENMAKL